jgi:hypothetical protein
MAVGVATQPETVMQDAAPDGLRYHYRTMEQLSQAADQLLGHIKQRPEINWDQFVIRFIESVREFAQQGGPTVALSRVEEALHQIQQNTTIAFTKLQKDTRGYLAAGVNHRKASSNDYAIGRHRLVVILARSLRQVLRAIAFAWMFRYRW